MNKFFTEPVCEVVEFVVDDIVTTSSIGGGANENETPDQEI